MHPPVLPETAPFTPAQRGWLNGYLAATWPAMTGGTSTPPAPAAKQGLPVTILWGSQTGTAESVAKKLAKKLTASGHIPTVTDMAAFELASLPTLSHLLLITSTYGDGEPPDNAADLHAALMAEDAPALPDLHYSVFALGDSQYPDFCQCGIEFDQRLAALGATALAARIDADVDIDEPLATWETSVLSALTPA
jgi:sulfite reductase (NADPH) flavoprotein alpha-component